MQVADRKVRLYGFDAPEKKQMCRDERQQEYPCGETTLLPAILKQ